jgi:hypothetical protein
VCFLLLNSNRRINFRAIDEERRAVDQVMCRFVLEGLGGVRRR